MNPRLAAPRTPGYAWPPHDPPEPHRRPLRLPVSGLTRDPFGATAAGEEVAVFTLTNDGGGVVRLLEIGAVIAGFEVPDRTGALADVVLGFDTVAEYEANPAYFGCATGRVANRIAGGRFELDGRVVQLAVNSPPNHIHGGEGGFPPGPVARGARGRSRGAGGPLPPRQPRRRGRLSGHPVGGDPLHPDPGQRPAHRLPRPPPTGRRRST